MVIISYHVQASHLPSYTSSLLETIQHQPEISLSSGDQTVSVSSLLLRISSPLSSLLQSPCPCSQSSSIVLPSSYSTVLPILMSLLYTGYATNLSSEQVEQLRLLTKELDMKTNFSIEPHQFEPDILGSVSGYNSTEQLPSAVVGDFNICVEDETDTSYGYSEDSDNFESRTFNNNHTIGGGHKRRRKVEFSEESGQNVEFFESELLSMCPPVRTRNGRAGPHVFVEPEDSVLADGIVKYEVGSELLEGEGRKVIEGWDDVCTGGDENIEVITVRDDVLYDDNFGDRVETLNVTSEENAIDPFCEIEIDSFNLEEEKARQIDRFVCKICDQAFVTDHNFKAHLASTHYESRLLKEFEEYGNVCPICNENSSDTLANMGHIGGKHEKVYDYYEADKFSNSGDVNSNWDRFNSKNNGSVKVHGRNHPTSTRTPPLRGILKLTNSGNKESPKSFAFYVGSTYELKPSKFK